ncbi:MAG: nitrogenase cofactor biosynthesis protein NifB [Magnetococcales bacterium]|nr:nitrogenase cofactor biosynthesis protein NifB [Magnetococcales bacterium]
MSSQCETSHGNGLVDNHPCFSKEAQHQVARMHLAVAPSCNIQCHYCNRKYDCSNESRPGVVSRLLTPEESVAHVAAVKDKIPQLTVVGIAGPGDPLANPDRTFATCRLVKESFPELMLCLSTNGLNLPDQAEKIARMGIHHVTLTLNTLDAEIGEKIYPWIFWKNRRIRGKEAVQILMDQQMIGIRKLVERGILVKVNSVLIPGINDEDLPKVHDKITSEGVFLHNIMPLISSPEHGTYYGLTGQREPLKEEMQGVQSQCGGVELMTHCRQCRADAVGMLGEDRSQEFSPKNAEPFFDPSTFSARPARVIPIQMVQQPANGRRGTKLKPISSPNRIRVAVASRDGVHINLHFGHTDTFTIYEKDPAGDVRPVKELSTQQYCFGDEQCGEREDGLETVIKMLAGCDAIMCERIGFTPWNRLKESGIKPINDYADWTIVEAIQDYADRVEKEAEAGRRLPDQSIAYGS